MARDPAARGFSLATLVATGAAALTLMAALAFEVRPLAELDGLTIAALLFGFFNALGALMPEGRPQPESFRHSAVRGFRVARPGIGVWIGAEPPPVGRRRTGSAPRP